MKRVCIATTAAFLAVGMFGSASAQTIKFAVDCAKGQTIAAAIARGDSRKPLVIAVRGTCNEFLTIARDDVTLRGDPSYGGTVNGRDSSADTIYVVANRTVLEDLTITGGRNGVRVQGPFDAVLRRVIVEDSAEDGILVRVGDVTLVNVTVQRAGGNGLRLARGATARVQSSTITANGANGIDLAMSSHGSISGSTITANGTDPEKRGNGVFVSLAHADIGGNTISGNRESGIHGDAAILSAYDNTIVGNGGGVGAYLGTKLVISGGSISENAGYGVYCNANCTAQVAGASIHGNAADGILLLWDSTLMLVEPVTDVAGNAGYGLQCGDDESSVHDTIWLNGSVSPACTGF